MQQEVHIHQDKLEEGLVKMVDMYYRHKHRYEEYNVFPEFALFKQFRDEHSKKERAQWVFLSAYFDHNKDSEPHYVKDMVSAFRQFHSGEMNSRLSLQPREGIFYEQPCPPTDDILTYLYSLNDQQLNLFMRKVMKSPSEDIGKKLELVSRYLSSCGKERQIDRYAEALKNKKSSQKMFKHTLDSLQSEYANDPRNIFYDNKDCETGNFDITAGEQRLMQMQGIGNGLRYLTEVFMIEAELLPADTSVITASPKVDWNDCITTQYIGAVELNRPVYKDNVIVPLEQAICEASENLGIPVVDIDYTLWAASKLTKRSPAMHKYSPIKDFASVDEVLDFRNSSNAYYRTGKIQPVTRL